MTLEERNVTVVRRWMEEVWNQKRPEVIDELFAPTGTATGLTPGGAALTGPDEFRKVYASLATALPDLHVTVDHALAQGDWVAVHLTCRATHRGELFGVAPSNQQVTIPVMTMARLQDGQIVEGWNVVDFAGLFRQAGALPPML